ncbi:MAG: DUF547 domain-containing protein [Robiginitomaculum sp.]
MTLAAFFIAPIAIGAAQPKLPPPNGASAVTPMQARDPFTNILKLYGSDDGALTRINYAALSASEADMGNLARYIDRMAAMTPSHMERDEALPYWANLYNALTVQVVAKNWPVTSIKQIKSGPFTAGPWKRDLVSVEGKTLSLDAIEHGIMRAQYPDPRIHYMVNCASVGCPNLRLKVWSADTLEADMDAAAARYINAARGARIEGGKLTVSSLYKWYKADFGDGHAGLIAHLSRYAEPELKAELETISKVSRYSYDWNVNGVK